MYTTTYVNSQGTLRVFAILKAQEEPQLIAELHGVMADKIWTTYQDVVDADFGNTDRNPLAYEFEFTTL